MNVAIIPARGGSKRIPGKNIKSFAGQPIIKYSMEAAIKTQLFQRIIVSTDDERIAEIAREGGAEVPFIRPAEISDDFTPTADVIHHALAWLDADGAQVEYACCIYATAPFVSSEYIKRGYELLLEKQRSSVFSVTTFSFPIFRALKINDRGQLEMFWPEYEYTRSNDLTEAYHDAGQFYWLDSAKFIQTKKLYSSDASPVILPRYLVQDIDTPEDWEMAERMFRALQFDNNGK